MAIGLKLVTLLVMKDGWRQRLSAAAKADGRSLRAISLASRLGANYLSELLTKGKEPSVSKLLALCEQLNVSATFILTGTEVSAESEEMLSILASLPAEQQATILALARQLKASRQ